MSGVCAWYPKSRRGTTDICGRWINFKKGPNDEIDGQSVAKDHKMKMNDEALQRIYRQVDVI